MASQTILFHLLYSDITIQYSVTTVEVSDRKSTYTEGEIFCQKFIFYEQRLGVHSFIHKKLTLRNRDRKNIKKL